MTMMNKTEIERKLMESIVKKSLEHGIKEAYEHLTHEEKDFYNINWISIAINISFKLAERFVDEMIDDIKEIESCDDDDDETS